MNSFYVISALLVIAWVIGFFYTPVSSLIHILLIIAVFTLIIGLMKRPTTI
jgi:hypothetical protein